MEYIEYIDNNNTNSGIYCIFNTRNGKLYIGSAVNLRRRVGQHISRLMNNNHHNQHLQRAWQRDGIISFLFVIIEYCSIEDLIKREQYFIDSFSDKIGRQNLYNFCLTAGSILGTKRTKDFKDKLSQSLRESTDVDKSKKPVLATHKKTGIELIFDSVGSAALYFEISRSSISEASTGKIKFCCRHRWEYISLYEQ